MDETKKDINTNITLEFSYLGKPHKLIWDKKSVINIIGALLLDKQLVKQVNKKTLCLISSEEIEKIADNIMQTIFIPQSIESIITELASKLMDLTLDVRRKNPKIIIDK